MPLEETLQRRGLSFSPSRGLAAPAAPGRVYGVVAGQPRAARSPPYAAARKPPEPLRRAVADCLSPPASHLHGSSGPNSSSSIAVEASRTLRDYIANPSTVDMAYSVLVDHALAERDRSPAVVPRCIALLKRYLAKYVPRVQTLRQIELFCANSLSKHDPALQTQLSEPVFTNPTLVKSIIYVRSLVAKHIPKLSFQPKQPFKNPLSSLKSRSFGVKMVSQEAVGRDGKEGDEGGGLEVGESSGADLEDWGKYVVYDLLRWRWRVDGQREIKDSESGVKQVSVEVGAAALLVGETEGRLESQSWRYPVDLLDINSLQPSQITDFASSVSHMKAITASKRLKGGPNEVWLNIPSSTFQPRARPLFQYRHYSEQQPLKLNPTEICEVISEVCSASSSQNKNQINTPSRLSNHGRQLDADVAFSVLIKLIIDMYMMDSKTAAPLTLYMLEGILRSQTASSKTRAFDLILNLGVHAHLIEPIENNSNNPTNENEEASSSQTSYANNNEAITNNNTNNNNNNNNEGQLAKSSAIESFESWLLTVLFEILLLLVQIEEREEIVWASALSCLFYFVCDRGNIIRNRLDGLDIRVIKAVLEISREHSWAEAVRSKLICMLTNMLYLVSPGGDSTPVFLIEQIDLLGGIDYICLEYSRARSKEEKRDLFLVLFDHAVHEINSSCAANGVASYAFEDIRPLVSLFTVNDFASEAFYLMVKNGSDGIGDVLRSSIFRRNSEFEHLNLILEKIVNKLEFTIRSFAGIDTEFLHMVQITKNYSSVQSIKEGFQGFQNPGNSKSMDASLAWVTLHSLLHSATSAHRHHGYIWLVDLLLSEFKNSNSDSKDSIWGKIERFQENVQIAGSQDNSNFKVPLAICVLCGLLKSKNNFIRFGFLFVLERFLTRFQLFLDEREETKKGLFANNNNSRGKSSNNNDDKSRLDKAVAVIDVMSSALSLVVQINETDHINILKMCDMLFWQLCLTPAKQSESIHQSETTSKAAQLLRGTAIAPMQLVRRVPASLLYWPLIQLAGAATDDIALGMAVGSTGRGNIPGATSDIRAALLFLLIGKCNEDPDAFLEVEGNEFFRGLLDDMDSRVAYYSSTFLLKRMMTEEPELYQRMLQVLIYKAQQSNNEKLLENPYLQMRGILQLSYLYYIRVLRGICELLLLLVRLVCTEGMFILLFFFYFLFFIFLLFFYFVSTNHQESKRNLFIKISCLRGALKSW
ncbi:hypothetical protein LUZ60_003857 [Juncus effusus]|nr:hypothetical protein LUZ60_003857 [Juncus effusus]